MDVLRELTESDVLHCARRKPCPTYTLRRAARAVLLNARGEVALLRVARGGYHKLPGGGLEGMENPEEALRREVLEETGARLVITGEVGNIVEYRDRFAQKQVSDCWLARLDGEPDEPCFTDSEREHGFELVWVKLADAADLLEADTPEDYVGCFIQLRDWLFLTQAQRILAERNGD